MMTVFGYEKSKVKTISANIFHNIYSQYNTLLESELSGGYYYSGNDLLYPLDDDKFKDEILKAVSEKFSFMNDGYAYVFHPNTLLALGIDTETLPKDIPEEANLYVDPDCNIPRFRLTEKYKKVMSPEKADYYVIPKVINNSACIKRHVVFYNSKSDTVYVGMETSKYINGKYININFTNFMGIEGKTMDEVIPTLKNARYKRDAWREDKKFVLQDLLDSVCVYAGYCLELPKGWHYISRIPLWKSKVITEDIVLANLGSEDKDMNKDIYDSIKSMLDSNSLDNVMLGLRILSELDYNKFKNSCVHLLENSSKTWTYHKSKLNSATKFMLRFLGCYQCRGAGYFKDSTNEDFELLREAIQSEIDKGLNKYIETLNNTYKFADINIDMNINIKRREDETN